MRDISRSLTPGHPNWPGDDPFTLAPRLRIDGGDSVNTALLSCSTHTGTHVDAPFHYNNTGQTLDQVPLEVYVGPCRVIHATGHEVVPASILDGVDNLPERVLLSTGQPAAWASFPRDFSALSPELVRALAERGVKLVGTDAPSVDPLTSKTLDAHRAFAASGLYILEGLNLAGVPAGDYQLVCLPLPLSGADGAPARAILLDAE